MSADRNMGDSGDSDKTISDVSRRKMLALGGGAVAGGLGGCLGDGDEEESPTDTQAMGPSPTPREETVIETEVVTVTGEERTVIETRVEEETVEVTPEPEPVEVTLDRPYNTVPTEVTFGWGGNAGAITNYYNTTLGNMGFDGRYRFEGLADYSLDGTELTFEIRDDLTYHNGETVTVDSFLYHQRQLYWVDPEGSDFTQQHEKVDDFTARYHYSEPPESELLTIAYFGFGMSYPEPYELETNQMLRDAWADDDSELADEILNNRVSDPSEQDTLAHKVEEGHGSTGPYMVASMDDMSDEELILTRHDEHPYMDETAPEQLRLNFAGGRSARDQMIRNDVTDFGNGSVPRRLSAVAPRNLTNLVNFSIPRMSVVHFNYFDKDVGNRGVRRAALSAVPLSNVRSSAESVVQPHRYQLGMTEGLSDNFLGSDFVSNRIKYPVSADTDRASTYMQAAGYSMQDGSWVDSEGEETDIRFVAKAGDAVVANAIVGPLNDFGLNVELQTESNSTYNQRVRQEFDYDMVLWQPHGCFSNAAHPNCFYRVDKHTNLALGGGASGAQDWTNATSLDDLEEGTHYVMEGGQAISRQSGKPLMPTIPSEHGQQRISGSGEEINLLALNNSLESDEFDPYAFQGARYFNFDVPAFDLWENTGGAWGDTQGFSWPAKENDDAWLLPSPIHSVIRKGQVSMRFQ